MSELSRIEGLKLRQSIYIFVLLLWLSGCITVRIINGENDSKLPEVNSLTGVTEVSPTISPSPMIIPKQSKIIEIPQPAMQLDTWYFFAVTRQGRTITIYLDGRAVSFGDFDPLNLDAPISLKFGRREGFQGFYLNGRIDEVEIYNGTALTPQQIYMLYSAGSSGKCKGSSTSTCVPPPSGLTGWWPGDGNGEELVSQRKGFFREDATTGPGLVSEAFEFDGDHEYFEVPDDPALNFGTRDFTVDLWVNFKDLTGNQILMEKWIQGDASQHPISQGWSLFWTDNHMWFVWEDGITQGGLTIYFPPYSTATPTIITAASP